MRWRGRHQSSNVEDRRGQRGKRPMMVEGGFGMLILLLVFMLLDERV